MALGMPWDEAGNQLLSGGIDSVGFISSVCNTQFPVLVHKHRLEVRMAEPVLFRLTKILCCKLCLQLAINLPKV